MRQDLLDRFSAVRTATMGIINPLEPDDWIPQSMPDASPVKWHAGHTSWFWEEFVLGPYVEGYRPFANGLGLVFNSYYVGAGPRYPRGARSTITRPTIQEVCVYRTHVDAAMKRLIENAPDQTLMQLVPLVELGINHEQQHQELILTDVKHLLSLSPYEPAYAHTTARRTAPTSGTFLRMRAGEVMQIGHAGNGFSFDNERPAHSVYVPSFNLASKLVTNGEYLAFIADGGYRKPELWLSEGFAAVETGAWNAPLYWRHEERTWKTFTLSGLENVRMDEPVCHVSFYEADAYARWAKARLPTEEEWEVAANDEPVTGLFLEHQRFHPRIHAHSPDRTLTDLFGSVWEWTASPYRPYPGFVPETGTIGEYNGKFMVNQMVLRGGSCVTPQSHIRATYRNFFAPHARWQFSGIRLAKDA